MMESVQWITGGDRPSSTGNTSTPTTLVFCGRCGRCKGVVASDSTAPDVCERPPAEPCGGATVGCCDEFCLLAVGHAVLGVTFVRLVPGPLDAETECAG